MKENIGKSVYRKEGSLKVTGAAKYVDDIHFSGLYFGATIRSPVARGILKDISFGEGVAWDEFTIVTAKDIPGKNYVGEGYVAAKDQPLLAEKQINHPQEPVVLIAHRDKYLVEKARKLVSLEIEALPAIFTIEESLAKKEIVWGEDNVVQSYLIDKGNVDSVWDRADFVVEHDYHTGAQEQLYIENQGVIADFDPTTGLTVWGSLQCPYYVNSALQPIFNLSADEIRVIQMETGGGFGGKEEYPTMISGHAGLLAQKSGYPVKMIYSRAEDMAATTKRHPSRSIVKTAHDKTGKLLAIEIDFAIDAGAYTTLSPVVLSRGTLHACGPYHCENSRVKSRAVATNLPPHGAFRGFGAPQSIFAFERHLDRAAKQIGISPEQIRRRNFLQKGQTTATSQTINEDLNYDHLLDRALEESNYHEKLKLFAKHNQTSPIKKGIGFATFMHGAGFTGSGEKFLSSMVGAQASRSGQVTVLAASTEIGQGTNTIFSQIAADALKLPYEDITVAQPDTSRVPNSGPTVASRTCMIVGKLVETAVLSLKKKLVDAGLLEKDYSREQFQQACLEYHEQIGLLESLSQYQQPPNVNWDAKNYRGDAYATFAWAVYVAEVSVDTTTYETQVDDFVALQEIGKVIHPVLASGQIEGGVAQGVGYAIYEKVVWKEGDMKNNQMTNYIMPTAVDVPPIRVFFEQTNQQYGPSGAKGIGELPMDGPAPAILNAVENATGVSVNHIPMLPEDLMNAKESTNG